MFVTCPKCNTRYDMQKKITVVSTVICAVCTTQLEVTPRGVMFAFMPKVVIRDKQLEE